MNHRSLPFCIVHALSPLVDLGLSTYVYGMYGIRVLRWLADTEGMQVVDAWIKYLQF